MEVPMNAQGFYISSQNRGPSGRLADWTQIKVDYVHIRVLDGLAPDPDATHNIAGARAAGIPWSAVQSYYPWLDATDQARALAFYGDKAPLGLAGDFEATGGMEAKEYMAHANLYALQVGLRWLHPFLVYTNANIGTLYLPSAWGKSNPLWIANPGSDTPHLPSQWSAWRFWQDDWTWSTPGVFDLTICHDQFNGTPGDLAALYHLTPQTDPLKDWRSSLTAWARTQGYTGPEAP
jgi:hypothetical protein